MTRKIFAGCTAIIATVSPLPALAASDYLLQIDDYAGPGKPATIELESWSFGATNPAVGAGHVTVQTARERGSGMATGRQACASGRHYPSATLSSARERWVLKEVVVSSCASAGMTIGYASALRVTKTRSNIQNN